MFKDFLVSTPNEKGKITTQTRKTQAGKTVYILYEIGRTYNAAKKYNVPHRVVIGKADPNDPEKMYPNEKYFEHFPQTVIQAFRASYPSIFCVILSLLSLKTSEFSLYFS